MKLVIIGSKPQKTENCINHILRNRNINPSKIYVSRRSSSSVPKLSQLNSINPKEAADWERVGACIRRVSFSDGSVHALIRNLLIADSGESIGIVEDSVIFNDKIPFCCNFIVKHLLSKKIRNFTKNGRLVVPNCFIYDKGSFSGVKHKVHNNLIVSRKASSELISSFGGIIFKKSVLHTIFDKTRTDNIYTRGGLLSAITQEANIILSFTEEVTKNDANTIQS